MAYGHIDFTIPFDETEPEIKKIQTKISKRKFAFQCVQWKCEIKAENTSGMENITNEKSETRKT